MPHIKYMTELRRLLAFSVPTFSSYNPDNAKNRVMPQIWLADEDDERRTRLEASTRPVYISSKTGDEAYPWFWGPNLEGDIRYNE